MLLKFPPAALIWLIDVVQPQMVYRAQPACSYMIFTDSDLQWLSADVMSCVCNVGLWEPPRE